MIDVIALGELLIDFNCISQTDDGYPTLAANPGGAPGNFLAALSKFGCKTAMIGKVGDDAFGKLLLSTMKEKAISTKDIIVDKNVFTTMAFVTLDDTGNREFSFARKPGADTCLSKEELHYSSIDDAKVFHFGTLSLTGEPARSATIAAVEYAKSKGKIISFDPNLRKPLWDSEEDAKDQILWGLSQSDVIKISDEEVEFLWGISPKEGAEKLLNEFGAKLVYVTLGPKGCLFANKNGFGESETPSGIKVLDTTGAGDIFGGSAMAMLLRTGKNPEDVSTYELKEITSFACAAASLSTTKHGGIGSVPEEDDVKKIMK